MWWAKLNLLHFSSTQLQFSRREGKRGHSLCLLWTGVPGKFPFIWSLESSCTGEEWDYAVMGGTERCFQGWGVLKFVSNFL